MRRASAKYGLPGYTVGISSKGCVTFSPVEDRRLRVASWPITDARAGSTSPGLYAMNRGIFMTPGREEEWTLSVQHTLEDADRYIAVFEEMAHDLVA
ncbi:MAG: hypothetical protein KatS3mg059_1610 [Thermomicrobiales bacterium]|nr:MAG: hypothetical protein KatS3mg059_1610 [Thermomicrobiales bacterium]